MNRLTAEQARALMPKPAPTADEVAAEELLQQIYARIETAAQDDKTSFACVIPFRLSQHVFDVLSADRFDCRMETAHTGDGNDITNLDVKW